MNLVVVHNILRSWVPRDPNIGFVLLAFGLIAAAFWLGALNSCLTNESPTDTSRKTWIMLIVFLGPIGALGYFLIRRPQRIREVGW